LHCRGLVEIFIFAGPNCLQKSKVKMKKLPLSIVLLIIVNFYGLSQPCLPDGISFTHQSEVDNFKVNHPNCTEIGGDVTVWGQEITNLDSLIVIEYIAGKLTLWETKRIKDLSGLDNLTSIDGSLRIGIGINHANDSLTSLSGLESLVHIGGSLEMYGNPQLSDLSGLNNLAFIGEEFSIGSNASLTCFSDLENLDTIGSAIYIHSNGLLTSLLGLDDINYVTGDLRVSSNTSLANLAGLDNISSISGDLKILSNNSITDLSELSNLTSVRGNISIEGNSQLINLSGLENIDPGTIAEVVIRNNENLSNCSVICICEYLKELYGIINLENNAVGCNSQYEVMELCGFTNFCLEDGITFTTQEEIDLFKLNHPDCNEVFGKVKIEGGNITNLDSLHVLTAIWGNLEIGRYFAHTTNLANLDGLINLTTIGGNLQLRCNEKLINLAGLSNVTSIGGDLSIYGNTLLENLQGLENLVEIPGNLYIGTTGVPGNNSLINLNGLNNITSIGGGLSVSNNTLLTSFEGLEHLETIGGNFQIFLIAGDTLINCSGLENLTSVGGNFIIQSTETLEDFTGLENLYTIGGEFTLMYNFGLTDLSNLSNLNSIGGQVQLYNNQLLEDFAGLENLTSIGGRLFIGDNDLLKSTAGLENVSSVGGEILIKENDVLESLAGFENIEASSIEHLYVFYNLSLTTCEAKSICEYLANPVGDHQIYGNAEGCNSEAEVEEACNAGIEDQHSTSLISIFPNPAENVISVSTMSGVETDEISIYNQIGQQVLYFNEFSGSIDISTLQPGMYIIEVVLGEMKIREKLVVQ